MKTVGTVDVVSYNAVVRYWGMSVDGGYCTYLYMCMNTVYIYLTISNRCEFDNGV